MRASHKLCFHTKTLCFASGSKINLILYILALELSRWRQIGRNLAMVSMVREAIVLDQLDCCCRHDSSWVQHQVDRRSAVSRFAGGAQKRC